VQAGADAVLVTESYGRQAALHDVLLEAVKSGQVSEERLNDAVRRQLALKAKRGLLPDTGPNAGKGLAAPAEALGTEAHRQLAFRVGAEALTLVRNKHLPLKLAPEQQLLVVGPAYGAAPALSAGISEQHANMTEVRVDRKLTPAQADTVRTASAGAAAVVYGVYNGHKYPEHQALIRRLIATGKPVLVVGLGEPYDLTELPEIQTYIAAYGYQSTNLQGVGALLFGTASPGGKLPVSVPGLYPIGHGLSF
ncbi:MAG TPA: glycoside hydrolase family 3 C-terminal domain-containing protein, partial [Symbiobacteriaceae bacterium]|nr:glycoside hydrolase family 3 C-terminal domain-containing protein [Symbiobacteriaceae bacterium]